MGIYIVLLILFFIGSNTIKPTKGVVLLLALVLFVVSAGRGVSVGIDTINYYQNGFSNLFEGENHQYEVVFVGLCDFIRSNGLNPRCCLYLLSAVTIIFICAASRRFKTNTIFVLFFFLLFNFFTHSLNIARQMAACSILLYANSFLFAKKDNSSQRSNHCARDVVLFLVFVLLAASFHVGAIIGVVALFSFVLHFERRTINTMTLSALLIAFFAIIQIGRGLLLSRSMGLLSTIAVYDSIGSETTGTTLSVFGFLYRSIAYFFYGCVLVYLKKDSNYKLCNFFLVSLVIRILLSAFYGSILRLGFYFSLIDIVVFSICAPKKDRKRRFFFYMATLYFGIDYFLTLSGNTYETVPYVFNMIEIF